MGVLGLSLLVALCLILAVRWMFSLWIKYKNFKLPNLPMTPVLGNLPQLLKLMDPAAFVEGSLGFAYMSKRQVGAQKAYVFHMPYLLVSSPSEAEKIFNSAVNLDKPPEYDAMRDWLGDGLLVSKGSKWHKRRKLLTPTFHYDILRDFIDIFSQQSQVLIDQLSEKSDSGKFDLWPYVTRCTLDVICETAMGCHVGAQTNPGIPYATAIYRLNELIHKRMKSPWLSPSIIFYLLGYGFEQRNCLKVIHDFTNSVIDDRKSKRQLNVNNSSNQGDKKRQVFLDLLLEMVEKGELPEEDVRHEVDTFMFEGHDTTAAGTNWTIYLLGLHPELQEIAAKEVNQFFYNLNGQPVTYESLGQLKFLECCIKEALRLYPSVPFIARKINKEIVYDTSNGKAIVPSGTMALVSPMTLHRHQDHWPDAEKFDPDRFLPENSIGRHPFAYVPFSAGSRNCIGQRFAILEQKTIIAFMLHHYEFHSHTPRHKMRPKAELIMRPSNGNIVSMSKRKLCY